MRFVAAIALGLFDAGSALACPGFPVRHYQMQADVVVAGKVAQGEGSAQQTIISPLVLKGIRQSAYPIVWPAIGMDDECAFLYPVALARGVFFLKRREDGRYDVLWAQKRWKMVR